MKLMSIFKKKFESDTLTAKVVDSILKMVVLRGGSILIGLLLVPVTINYITASHYGFWLTISSVVGWLSFFDVGLGHGLRNNLTKAVATDDYEKGRSLISTTYVLIVLIAIGILIISTPIILSINWSHLLNIRDIDERVIKKCIIVVCFGFCVQFVLNVINSILLAIHKSATSTLLIFVGQLAILITVFLLGEFSIPNIFLLTTVLMFLPVLLTFGYTIYFFRNIMPMLRPSVADFSKTQLPALFGLGFGFFIVQIGSLVLFQTDNFIVSILYGPEAVTEFNVAFRLFSLVTMFNFIVLTPFWSAFTEAWANDDFIWMKRTLKILRSIWFFFVVAAIVLYVFGSSLIKIWVGDEIEVSKSLLFSLMIYSIAVTFQATHNYIINGIGKIKLQVVLMILSATLNIPLSFLLGKLWGIQGVVYANVLFILVLGLSFYFQCNVLIKNRKTRS